MYKKLIGYLLNLIFLAGWGGFYLFHLRLLSCAFDVTYCGKFDPSVQQSAYHLIFIVLFSFFLYKIIRCTGKLSKFKQIQERFLGSVFLGLVWLYCHVLYFEYVMYTQIVSGKWN